jgi:hypothetical protein
MPRSRKSKWVIVWLVVATLAVLAVVGVMALNARLSNQPAVVLLQPGHPTTTTTMIEQPPRLSDPYAPPLRRQSARFRQMGLLVPLNGTQKDNILPLMGRIMRARRSLWQYYGVSNQRNGVKLPVFVKNKSGMSDYGVDELYNGDTVGVGGVNEVYVVELYENNGIQYDDENIMYGM